MVLLSKLTFHRLEFLTEHCQQAVEGVGLDFLLAGEVIGNIFLGHTAFGGKFSLGQTRPLKLINDNAANFFTHYEAPCRHYVNNDIGSTKVKPDLRLQSRCRALATTFTYREVSIMDSGNYTKHGREIYVSPMNAYIVGAVYLLRSATHEDVCGVIKASSPRERQDVAVRLRGLYRALVLEEDGGVYTVVCRRCWEEVSHAD